MIKEPDIKKAITFFDGQNLYRSAKEAFGVSYPNYCPIRLSKQICKSRGYKLVGIRFYTGVPTKEDSELWNGFWTNKLAHMKRLRVDTIPRPVRNDREKGVDVKIALDMVRFARLGNYDVGIVFSQDQDLIDAVKEVKEQAWIDDKWIKIVSAFPLSDLSTNRRGINHTDWLPIDSKLYNSCVDPNEYRPKKFTE